MQNIHGWFSLFVALNGLLILTLALNISRLRITEKIPYGDGDNLSMKQAIRAHANAVEHAPVYGLMLLALLILPGEQASQAGLIAALVGSFTLARFIHAYGMLGRVFNARRLGAGITYLCELALVVILFARLLST